MIFKLSSAAIVLAFVATMAAGTLQAAEDFPPGWVPINTLDEKPTWSEFREDQENVHLYLPKGDAAVRGIFVCFVFHSSDPRELARHWNFALVTVPWPLEYDLGHGDKRSGRFKLGHAEQDMGLLLRYLEHAAEKTGHAELATVPIVGWLGQGGSHLCADLYQRAPERVLAWSDSFPNRLRRFPEMTKRVPFAFAWEISKKELREGERKYRDDEVFLADLSCRANTYGFGHGIYSKYNFFMAYLDRCIQLRMPEQMPPPGEPVKLKPAVREKGWVGDFDPISEWNPIRPADAESQASLKYPVWFPDAYAAWMWRSYHSAQPEVKLTGPVIEYRKKDGKWGGPECGLGYGGYLTAGEGLTFSAKVDGDYEKVEYHSGDQIVATADAAPWSVDDVRLEPGLHALFAVGVRQDGSRAASRPAFALVVKPGEGDVDADVEGEKPSSCGEDEPPQDGDGEVTISGELKQWHNVTLTMNGPFARETDDRPNPFTDYALTVTFAHESGQPKYAVAGYFAADGDAANSSATEGNRWRAHLSPDKVGRWNYEISFLQSRHIITGSHDKTKTISPLHGKRGSFEVGPSDKMGRDLRREGRLQYVGQRYLQFAGSKRFFLKAGADAPETLLAYADFDGTIAGNKKKAPLKSWQPHVRDWRQGDPTWGEGRGKGLIGAVNYLSDKGCNAFSFLTYNAGGDGDNVWPFVARDDKLHYDCSKLDQWAIVFQHATSRGMYLHFKMQETENDDKVKEALDGGDLGIERQLYCRELAARFGHNLALNWNLGEENTQSTAEQQAMMNFIARVDPYDHPIVVHTYPNKQEAVYRPLLGEKSRLTGLSLQNSNIKDTHQQTVKWVRESTAAGKPWVVAFDESGSAAHGQPPDLGYREFAGRDAKGKKVYTQHDVRKQTLWGTLMGGGAGVEYYFGYQFTENDLLCQDWRSRDQSWDYCRIALEFFAQHEVPFDRMSPADELVGNKTYDNSRYCLAQTGECYLVYLPQGGSAELDLTDAGGEFDVSWFNPRVGGELQTGTLMVVDGGKRVSLGTPPKDVKEDWLVMVRRKKK